MITQASRTKLDTVEHQIVVRRAHLVWLWTTGQCPPRAAPQMAWDVRPLGLFKEWEIYYEKEVPWAVSAPLQTLAKLDAQPAQDVTRQRRAVSDKE